MAWYLCTAAMLVHVPGPHGEFDANWYIIGTHIHVPDRLNSFGGHPYAYIAVFTLAILIGIINDRNGVLSRLLSWKPLAWIGVISYGLYLYHFFIIVVLSERFLTPPTADQPPITHPWKVVAIGIPLTFLIATISFYAVEKPCLKLKDRFRGPRLPSSQPDFLGAPMPQAHKSMPENPDNVEHSPGFAHEKLEGWIPALASDAEISEALEKAFDYRGDVTITRKDGSTIEGYIFDRRTGASLADSAVRLFPKDQDQKLSVPYNQIAALAYTGRDTAAGKTWETWLKKYAEKKAAGEKNIGLEAEKLD